MKHNSAEFLDIGSLGLREFHPHFQKFHPGNIRFARSFFFFFVPLETDFFQVPEILVDWKALVMPVIILQLCILVNQKDKIN